MVKRELLRCLPRWWLQHRRGVSKLSPLGVAFNSKPGRKLNLNLHKDGLFGIPELKDFTGFYLLEQQAEAEAEALVKEASDPNRSRLLVQVFDSLSDCLCRVADMADFVRVAHPDHQYAEAAEDACTKISALVEKLNTNTDIHNALREAIDRGDKFPEDEIDKRVAELFMFDFEQSGIHLPEEKRQLFVKLNESILMLGATFQHRSLQPITVPRDAVPDHLRNIFTNEGDKVTVTGLYNDNDNDLVREAAYRLYLYPDRRQLELLEALLTARNQLAELVEFPTYAHRALRSTMAHTPENVMDFLETLAKSVRPLAERDIEDIRKKKKVPTATLR